MPLACCGLREAVRPECLGGGGAVGPAPAGGAPGMGGGGSLETGALLLAPRGAALWSGSVGVPAGQVTVRLDQVAFGRWRNRLGQTVLPEVAGPALDQEFSMSGSQCEQEGVCRSSRSERTPRSGRTSPQQVPSARDGLTCFRERAGVAAVRQGLIQLPCSLVKTLFLSPMPGESTSQC